MNYNSPIPFFKHFVFLILVVCIRFHSGAQSNTQFDFIEHRIQPDMITIQDTHPVDFDGDGDQDIISLAIEDSLLFWHENDGNENFTLVKIPTETNELTRVLVRDLDGDGDQDFVTCSWTLNEIVWYQNDGSQNFTAYTIEDSLAGVSAIDIADLDGDGDLDVLASAYVADQIVWYKNDGNQNFSSVIIDDDAGGAWDVHVSDYNLDGEVDIFAANFDDEEVKLYYNFGNEVFLERVIKDNYKAQYVTTGNLEGDSVEEVVFSSYNEYKVYIYRQGSTWFTPPGFNDAEVINLNMVVGPEILDMDNDGDNDLVLGPRSSGSTIRWYENLGTTILSLQNHIVHTIHEDRKWAKPVDLDSDGDIDIVSANRGEDRIYWFENDSTQVFTVHGVGKESYGFQAPHIEDFDGDGSRELIYRSHSLHDSTDINISYHLGDYEFQDSLLFRTDDFFIDFTPTDLDDDGDLDFVYWRYVGSYDDEVNVFKWLENIPGQNLQMHILNTVNIDGHISDLKVLDLDGDGDLDLSFLNLENDEIEWLTNDGNQNFTYGSFNVGNVSHYAVINLDSDLDLDFLFTVNFSPRIRILNNNGAQNFNLDTIPNFVSHAYDMAMISTDFDLDGDDDFIGAKKGGQGMYYFKNDSNQSFLDSLVIDSLKNFHSLQAIDFTGDGFPDLAFSAKHLVENYYRLYIMENDGQGNFSIWYKSPKAYTSEQYYGDVDNDGDLDIFTKGDNNYSSLILENLSINDYITLNIKPFVDNNDNGIFDSLDVVMNNANLDLSPGGYYQFSNPTGVKYYIEQAGTYELNLNADSLYWDLVDSLNRTIEINPSNFQDSSFYIGVKPRDIILIADIVGNRPRCADTIHHKLSIENFGNIINQGTVEYQLDSLSEFISSIPQPDSIDGLSYYYNYQNLMPSYKHEVLLKVIVPSLLDTLNHTLINRVDTGQVYVNNVYPYQEIVLCSYDPNDKQELTGKSEEGYFLSDSTELEYLIRFQNTGNDTAYLVEVLDTLDTNLDLNTFHRVSNSHPVTVHIDHESREAKFRFENINLTDTVTNVLESEGFVKFRIRTIENLSTNVDITNTAHIYFDQNSAIVTNTTLNTTYDCSLLGDSIDFTNTIFDLLINNQLNIDLYQEYLTSAQWLLNDSLVSTSTEGFNYNLITPGDQSLELRLQNDLCIFDTTLFFTVVNNIGLTEDSFNTNVLVHPNPTSGDLNIEIGKQYKKVDFIITNNLGQLISKRSFLSKPNLKLKIEGEQGLYFLEIKIDDQSPQLIKILKK